MSPLELRLECVKASLAIQEHGCPRDAWKVIKDAREIEQYVTSPDAMPPYESSDQYIKAFIERWKAGDR